MASGVSIVALCTTGVSLLPLERLGSTGSIQPVPAQPRTAQLQPPCNRSRPEPAFLVFGGGGSAEINEISLEKNLLYFQRTLKLLGYNPAQTLFYFANGTDGNATVRYLDSQGREQFKPPEIPHLQGGSTRSNLTSALQQLGQRAPNQAFLYFTGHGNRTSNLNNNTFNLWPSDDITVQEFTQLLDQLPSQTAVTVVMAQCYSGSFANIIYPGGQPGDTLAPQPRCGFFATVKEKPSVGCTPAVDEADYEDYSSSFFAGLSGQNRVGKPVASADYNQDGRVSYAEAHAFVKIDAQTTDLPVSTSEVWLQEWVKQRWLRQKILFQPIATIVATARPEQKAVVAYLVSQLQLDATRSYDAQWSQIRGLDADEVKSTYARRLLLELMNIGGENLVRKSQDTKAIAVLEQILRCESGSWQGAK